MNRTRSTSLIKRAALAVAALTVCASAHAGLITIGGAGVVNADHVETFEGIAPMNRVTNQFAGNGLVFTTLSGNGIAATNNNQCGNSSQGVTGGYLYMGLQAPCSGSNVQDGVSLRFAQDVSELSWTGFHRASGAGFNILALNDGVVVSSLLFGGHNRFENRTVLFSGSTFDELRFTENGTSSAFFALDNMRWTDAAEVPEPGMLALVGLGLLGAAYRRRKSI